MQVLVSDTQLSVETAGVNDFNKKNLVVIGLHNLALAAALHSQLFFAVLLSDGVPWVLSVSLN